MRTRCDISPAYAKKCIPLSFPPDPSDPEIDHAPVQIQRKTGHLATMGHTCATVTILWLRHLTVGLIDCHVIRKTRAVGSTPDEGHCTVLRAQPLLRCVNIWTVYLSPSRLLIAYSFAYACLLMAYSFAYLCLRIAYWFLPSR